MATRLLRIVSPSVVLLVFFWALGTTPDVPEPSEGQVSIEQSRAWAEEADMLVRDGRAADALGLLTQLNHAFPNNTIYIWNLAEAQRARGDYLAAAEFLELYMDQSPVPWAACPTIGDDYWSAGRLDEGLASYQRCLDLEPSNPDYVLALGLANERLGHLREAGVLFAEGERLAADYADFQIASGRLLIRTGQPHEAEKKLVAVLQQESESPDGLFALGLALERQGRLGEAEDAYNAGLVLSPDNSDMVVGIARLRLRSGDAETARRLATESLSRDPGSVDAMLIVAMALERLNRLDAARGMAEQVIERSPTYGDAYLVLGRIAENQGRDSEALRLYDQLLEIQPDHPDAAKARARVGRGAE